MAISTLVFNRAPYKNVLTLGLILDEDGEKMSKSKGNAVDPMGIMNSVGADAVRFYLYSSPVWKSRRFSENLVKEYMQKTIMTLWNVVVFFKKNAELDGYHGEMGKINNELDRWLISRINSTVRDVRKYLDSYEVHLATRALERFIDELSNWYVRRSRRRFWREEMNDDKMSAYTALYKSLRTLSLLMAPFTPFLADNIYRETFGENESVHLENYPVPDNDEIDEALEEEMNVAIKIAEAGRRARQLADIKLRQPLSKMTISCDERYAKLVEKFIDVLKEEVNVKSVEIGKMEGMTEIEVKINYRTLGPKLKSDMKKVTATLNSMSKEEIAERLKNGELVVEGYKLTEEDISIFEKPVEGVQAVEVEGLPIVVYLDTNITDELKKEGLARELIRRIQTMRKDMNLDYDAKIKTYYKGDSLLESVMQDYREHIMKETQSIALKKGKGEYEKEWEIEKNKIKISISP